jgi:hypothetical protein
LIDVGRWVTGPMEHRPVVDRPLVDSQSDRRDSLHQAN